MRFDVTCKELPNGDLAVLANNRARAWIKEEQERHRATNSPHMNWSECILHEVLEGYWTNGMYQPFNAGDANPFIGLSNAPCIAEAMDMDDLGRNYINGRWWAFTNYQLEDPVETLKCRGRVVFEYIDSRDPIEDGFVPEP